MFKWHYADGIDFREIANAHSRYYHALFQKASDELNPYWKRYCELNNRLDYLPLGSEDYKETEKECEAAKAEHDRRQTDVKENSSKVGLPGMFLLLYNQKIPIFAFKWKKQFLW